MNRVVLGLGCGVVMCLGDVGVGVNGELACDENHPDCGGRGQLTPTAGQ